MIKRSENHEAYCNRENPHFFISENGTGLYCSGGPRVTIDPARLFESLGAVWRMDKIWADALSKRISP